MLADELRRQADNFVELNDLADSITRNHGDRTAAENETIREPA